MTEVITSGPRELREVNYDSREQAEPTQPRLLDREGGGHLSELLEVPELYPDSIVRVIRKPPPGRVELFEESMARLTAHGRGSFQAVPHRYPDISESAALDKYLLSYRDTLGMTDMYYARQEGDHLEPTSIYQVAQKIDGTVLDAVDPAAAERPSDEELRQLMAGCVNFYAEALANKQAFPRDISLRQFMYGRTPQDPTPRIYLHDLDLTMGEGGREFDSFEYYEALKKLHGLIGSCEKQFGVHDDQVRQRVKALSEFYFADANLSDFERENQQWEFDRFLPPKES